VTTPHPVTANAPGVPSAGYEIRIKGRLSRTVTGAFEDFSASVRPAETTLRGEVRDPAELQAMLDLVQSLGLELIEVKRVDR
jgi:hypothetical protein